MAPTTHLYSSKEAFSKREPIRIVKLHLAQRPSPAPVYYGYTHPELYLTLIENKLKVKEELLNIDYNAGVATIDARNSTPVDNSIVYDPKYVGGSASSQYYDDANIESDDSEEGDEDNGNDSDGEDYYNSNDAEQSVEPASKQQKLNHMDYIKRPEQQAPPSISALTQQFQDNARQTDEEKMTIIAEFNLLSRRYPNSQVPFVSMHMDVQHIKDLYQRTIRTLQIDQKHQSYRTYLIMGFYLVEFVFGNFLKLKMSGFAQKQIEEMDKYDRLLIELGDKHYVPNAPERFPVEVRLAGLIAIQTALYIIIQKMTGGKNGNEGGGLGGIGKIFSMFSNPTKFINNESNKQTQQAASTSQAQTSFIDKNAEQKIMKGPQDSKQTPK